MIIPKICSLHLLKHVYWSLEVNHLSFKYVSPYWYKMKWILEFIDFTSLIHNYVPEYMLITTVENMSLNITWYCGEIGPVVKFRTYSSCVECIFMNPILTPIWLLGDNLVIFNSGFWNSGSKTYVALTQTWKLLHFSDTNSNLYLDHILISDISYWILGIQL